MLIRTKFYKTILLYLIVSLFFFSCGKIENENTTSIENQIPEKISTNTDLSMCKKKPGDTLKYLGKFETLVSFGFTPDDVTYSPEHGGRLFLSAVGTGIPYTTPQGVFEVTPKGELIQSFTLPAKVPGICLGFSIARISNGPKIGHFFLVNWTEGPQTQVWEFDQEFNVLNQFPLAGSGAPSDALAYNPRTKTLVIVDPGPPSELIEFTKGGKELNSFQIPNTWGITFNEKTGTYFSVYRTIINEISASGILLNSYDLSQFGIVGAVGIAYGEGKLYIADTGDNPPYSVGLVHIMQVSRK